jgi:hypothetical protein
VKNVYFLTVTVFWYFTSLLLVLAVMLIAACVREFFQREKNRKALNIVISLVIIFSLLVVSTACISDNSDEEIEIYGANYDYKVNIENSSNSTIGIDIPLPHNEVIFKNLSFEFYQDFPFRSKWPSSARIEMSEYGKVLHVETNATTIVISRRYLNPEYPNKNPVLSLTTQQGDSTYIKLTNKTSGNVSIFLKFGHLVALHSSKDGYRQEHEYLRISTGAGTGYVKGFPLVEGWNLVPVEHLEWILPQGSD